MMEMLVHTRLPARLIGHRLDCQSGVWKKASGMAAVPPLTSNTACNASTYGSKALAGFVSTANYLYLDPYSGQTSGSNSGPITSLYISTCSYGQTIYGTYQYYWN